MTNSVVAEKKEKMMGLDRRRERKNLLRNAEVAGIVADSHEVRLAIMRRVHAGEISLEQAQSELKKIKSSAKKNGLVTRNQASNGVTP